MILDRLDTVDLRTGRWNLGSESLLVSATFFCSATDAVVVVGGAG